MSSLLAALQTSASALGVFEKALGTVQNNVTNASTPGYTAQSLELTARPFQPGSNLWGGVAAGNTRDSRNQFAEQAVWTQSELLGSAKQKASALSSIEAQFDVSGTTGIPGMLSKLSSAFSAWGTSPDDPTARNQVISAAQNVAQSFNTAYSNLKSIQSQTDTQIAGTVTQINQAVSEIKTLNQQIGQSGGTDAGLQAQMYSQLQNLASLTPITVHTAPNGTLSVLMNGQVQLLTGTTQTVLHVSYPQSSSPTNPGGTAAAAILDDGNQDVTAKASGGQLGGLLEIRNSTLPGLIGDQNQVGSLNQLAKSYADRVNNIMKAGVISVGPPAVPGRSIFTYDTSLLGAVAGTIMVPGDLGASDLAAIQTTPTTVANGVPTQLANLQSSSDPQDQLDGTTFSGFYGKIATDVGNQASAANDLQSSQSDLLDQAENFRSQVSGVDLNEQAAKLLEYQQAYEASSKIISVVNELTSDLMNLIQ